MSKFKDHFSAVSENYAEYRPHYPDELFEYLDSITQHHESAWDCATGSGQAALGLSPYFDTIFATDASEEQIRNAYPHQNIQYHVATAYQSGLPESSIDLVTAAQALHWFEFDTFFSEVKRVLKPSGLLAAWCYGVPNITPELDPVVEDLYFKIIGPYWPAEREYVDKEYGTIRFPFPRLSFKQFTMTQEWDLDHFTSYVSTWSASKRLVEIEGKQALHEALTPLAEAWGVSSGTRVIQWPVHMRTAKMNT